MRNAQNGLVVGACRVVWVEKIKIRASKEENWSGPESYNLSLRFVEYGPFVPAYKALSKPPDDTRGCVASSPNEELRARASSLGYHRISEICTFSSLGI